MIQKIQNSAIERYYSTQNTPVYGIHEEVKRFVIQKINALTKGLFIPEELISEADKFISRNIIENTNLECCSRCLKAFVIKRAQEMALPEKEMRFISMMLTGKTGHDGYFLDGEKVIKSD